MEEQQTLVEIGKTGKEVAVAMVAASAMALAFASAMRSGVAAAALGAPVAVEVVAAVSGVSVVL